jgi:hypothetical protein
MHFQGVDHPGPTAVSAQGSTHGEQHLGSVPLTDHGFVLCVRNIANETVAVRIEVWGSNDFDVTDFNTQPGEYLCCKVADIAGAEAGVRLTASGGEIEYEICSNNL